MTSQAPQKLGRYEILEEIGKGAMGVVYLARDPLIGRQVALKTFRVGFSAKDQELAQFRSRFVREAQSAGILSHPNIVTIHDVVDEGAEGICFIAMEYVKGTNLKQLMQRPEPISHDRVVDILAQIAEGLDYAHSRGVVHRDIKPANILISQDGKVKITDFGIARLDTSNLTMEGQLLGTPNYMAPEQIQGKEVDHRADIFSLGVVFYEMLTRKKPFQGENLTAVTHKIVYEPFTPAEELIQGLPAGLTAVMTRCLEKDPNRRYPRAAEIAAELRSGGGRSPEVAAVDDDDTQATQEVPEVADETVRRPVAPLVPPPAAARPALPTSPPAPAVPPPPVSVAAVSPAAPSPTRPAPGAGPVASATPASAPPVGAPGSSAAPAAAAPRQTGKWIQWGLLGFAGLAVVGILALWISGKSDPPAPPAAGPTVEEQRALDLQTALTQARGRLDAGDLQGALTALAEAQRLDPENSAARSLRAEVDRVSLDLASAAEREQRVSEGLILAREEYSKKRYEAAIAAARGVLALVPDHPEAAKLATDSEAAWNRQKDREKAQKSGREATEAAAAAVPAPLPPPVKPATPAPVAAPAPDATVNIDFYSELSEGVLTVYSGERQIYREPFKFVRKTGLLSKEKIPGALAAERKLPAGAVALRVYVTLPGKPTKAIVLDENLVGGSTRQLVIRVDADARVEARLE